MHGLDLYDYHARQQDPALGRFTTMDPLAEKDYSWSPYAYCLNNPIRFIDPDGRSSTVYRGAAAMKIFEEIKRRWGDDEDEEDSFFPEWLMSQARKVKRKGASIIKSHIGKPNREVTPFDLGVEWLTGEGPRQRDFVDGDIMTEMVKSHGHVQDARDIIVQSMKDGSAILRGREKYDLSGVGGVAKYIKDYSTIGTLGNTGNLAVTYLGSYDLDWRVLSTDPMTKTATVQFLYLISPAQNQDFVLLLLVIEIGGKAVLAQG